MAGIREGGGGGGQRLRIGDQSMFYDVIICTCMYIMSYNNDIIDQCHTCHDRTCSMAFL